MPRLKLFALVFCIAALVASGQTQTVVTKSRSNTKDNIQVVLNELGPHSLDILLNFFLKVPDRMAELNQRQEILFDILRLAEAMEVRFAFPTQTLHIESLPGEMRAIVNRSAGSCPETEG